MSHHPYQRDRRLMTHHELHWRLGQMSRLQLRRVVHAVAYALWGLRDRDGILHEDNEWTQENIEKVRQALSEGSLNPETVCRLYSKHQKMLRERRRQKKLKA